MVPKNLLARNSKIGKRYNVVAKIGEGSFGEVYKGIDLKTEKYVAIKVESMNAKYALLSGERDVYHFLKGGIGFPTVKHYGEEKDCKVLVMNLLGPSLQDLFERCENHFSLKTILMIADQVLERIIYIHNKKFIHLDIKPENIVVGIDPNDPLLYIIDFGVTKNYMDQRTKRHIPFKIHDALPGTAEYSSLNTHFGVEQSRRDDMETLGYVLIYFWKGKLPWEGMKARNAQQKYEKMFEKKISTSVKQMCKGMPKEFVVYMDYCRSLHFTDEPDYKNVRNLFRDLFKQKLFENDNIFDWDLLSS